MTADLDRVEWVPGQQPLPGAPEDGVLFHVDAPPPVEPGTLSADRRRTLRLRADVDRGVHPLTGAPTRPELGTCGTCAHRVRLSTYQQPKCDVGPLSKSATTDVRRWWPACGQFRPRGAP